MAKMNRSKSIKATRAAGIIKGDALDSLMQWAKQHRIEGRALFALLADHGDEDFAFHKLDDAEARVVSDLCDSLARTFRADSYARGKGGWEEEVRMRLRRRRERAGIPMDFAERPARRLVTEHSGDWEYRALWADCTAHVRAYWRQSA